MHITWLIISGILLLALAACYAVYKHRQQELIDMRVNKLYASSLYVELLPFLRTVCVLHLDQIKVDKTGLRVRCWYRGRGDELSFLMKEHGYGYLTQDQQMAMCKLLEREIPELADAHKFTVMVKRYRLLNGDPDRECIYAMSSAYKSECSRAERYEKGLYI